MEHLTELEQIAAQPVGQQLQHHLSDYRIELEQLHWSNGVTRAGLELLTALPLRQTKGLGSM